MSSLELDNGSDMKVLLPIFFLALFTAFAQAATMASSEEYTADPRSIIYAFKFSMAGHEEPLNVTEFSCWKLKRGKKEKVTDQKWDCSDNIDEAKVKAQKKAEQFEVNLIKNGNGAVQ